MATYQRNNRNYFHIDSDGCFIAILLADENRQTSEELCRR